jgi:hypothetical protein
MHNVPCISRTTISEGKLFVKKARLVHAQIQYFKTSVVVLLQLIGTNTKHPRPSKFPVLATVFHYTSFSMFILSGSPFFRFRSTTMTCNIGKKYFMYCMYWYSILPFL